MALKDSNNSFDALDSVFNNPFFVYILKCSDGKYYVGKTKNIRDRLFRHSKGYSKYTSKRLPVKLITYIALDNEWKAVLMEKYLKSGSGRAFAKKRLI